MTRTEPPAVKITPIYYDADVHCSLIRDDLCDFQAHGPDAKVQAINHTKITGHDTIARAQSTEEIRLL